MKLRKALDDRYRFFLTVKEYKEMKEGDLSGTGK